jgi:hypothetical protein
MEQYKQQYWAVHLLDSEKANSGCRKCGFSGVEILADDEDENGAFSYLNSSVQPIALP